MTLTLTINETLIKVALITAHLNAGVTVAIDIYDLPLFPFFPSLISLVDFKHHVYLLGPLVKAFLRVLSWLVWWVGFLHFRRPLPFDQ